MFINFISEIYLNEQIRNVDFESDQMLGFADSVIWAHSESLHDSVPPPEKKNSNDTVMKYTTNMEYFQI